ncbi:MAG TPA: chemotaxis protein CheB, partial [Casimicrobiaceae bacterium]|nr:chemotaxis protein CheB [Casimicrobiaceae bacterium]
MDQPLNAPASAPAHVDVPVVGIGASAGGIKALLEFFEHMPQSSGMAFVVVLHLSPKHESSLDKVLQAVTKMPVQQVNESVQIEKDHVYVISPAKELAMFDGTLQVSATSRQHGRHTAIDLFFRTLAKTKTSRAVCIVLSGTGSDGTVGMKSIKEEGGIAIAQQPDEAEYDEMPRNAILTATPDFVLPVGEMPQKLISLLENARRIELPHADELPIELDTTRHADLALREVLATLRSRTGHDFAQYKRATVLRRIERRMQVNQVHDLPAYRDLLRDNIAETRPLLKDMLISVTNFFRDREAFEALERIAIPAIFEGKSTGDQVRVWVPGCATGEEAYSIAILLEERARELEAPPDLQIFATDIDEDALAVGRAAIYPEAIVTDVPPARLRHCFAKEAGGYRVQKFIRDRVTFAPHNLIKDPPFSRVDLVSCRNVLIYLNREIQGTVLDLVRFALRSDGFLFLGTSESIDEAHDTFVTVDKSHRLFRAQIRSRARPVSAMLPSSPATSRALTTAGTPAERRSESFSDLHQGLLESYAPPSVVVDDQYRIVHLSENAGQFLQFTAGEPSLNLVHAVHPDLRLDLRTALYQAMQTMKRVAVHRVAFERPGGTSHVNVTVHPVCDVPTSRTFALVVFDERFPTLDAPTGESAEEEAARAGSIALESELSRMRGQLRTTVEQYETQNEELKASNEELQAINEELRSATEELETSKEELQSINEELATVNQELKSRVEETVS